MLPLSYRQCVDQLSEEILCGIWAAVPIVCGAVVGILNQTVTIKACSVLVIGEVLSPGKSRVNEQVLAIRPFSGKLQGVVILRGAIIGPRNRNVGRIGKLRGRERRRARHWLIDVVAV